jgi:hypothetical protein
VSRGERKKAHAGLTASVSLKRVQIRVQIESTLSEYVAQEGWQHARLLRCPLHPDGGCGFSSHGTYLRKYPIPHRISRYYCRSGQTTFGLIPDFAASQMPGTLDEIESAVAVYEGTGSIYKAAEVVRPPETHSGDPTSLAATSQWLSRRVRWVQATLITVAGLFPELFAGLAMTVTAFRAHLQSERVLVDLREICSCHLVHLPAPIGFGPRQRFGKSANGASQQSMRSDRPP